MEINDKRNLVVRIFKKEERGLPRHAAVNSVLAGFSQADRDEVVAQLAAEERHAVVGPQPLPGHEKPGHWFDTNGFNDGDQQP